MMLADNSAAIQSHLGRGREGESTYLQGWNDNASTSAVVQVDVGDLHASVKGLRVHGIVVVLRADFNPPCMQHT